MPDGIPPEAVETAASALYRHEVEFAEREIEPTPRWEGYEHIWREQAKAVLEAALPHLLEAEREARQLAESRADNWGDTVDGLAEDLKVSQARCAELEADHAKTIEVLKQRDVQLYMAEQRMEELETELALVKETRQSAEDEIVRLLDEARELEAKLLTKEEARAVVRATGDGRALDIDVTEAELAGVAKLRTWAAEDR